MQSISNEKGDNGLTILKFSALIRNILFYILYFKLVILFASYFKSLVVIYSNWAGDMLFKAFDLIISYYYKIIIILIIMVNN